MTTRPPRSPEARWFAPGTSIPPTITVEGVVMTAFARVKIPDVRPLVDGMGSAWAHLAVDGALQPGVIVEYHDHEAVHAHVGRRGCD